jgi:hypothetical protein
MTFIHLSTGIGLPSTRTSSLIGRSEGNSLLASPCTNLGRAGELRMGKINQFWGIITGNFNHQILFRFAILIFGNTSVLANTGTAKAKECDGSFGAGMGGDTKIERKIQN